MSWDEWKQQRAHYLKKNARIAELEAQLAECQRERDELKEWHTVEYKALEKERDALRDGIYSVLEVSDE